MAYDGPPADVGRMQVNPAGPRPNTVGSGSPDPNASTGPPGYGGGGFGGDPYGGGGGYGSYGNPGSGYSPYPGYGQDMGYGRNPWTMTWGEIGGQYTPTLDPMTVSGLYNTNQYVNSGMGLGSSQQYINDVLSGRYTNPNTNPGLQSIYSGMLGIKNDQDALAQRRIGSSLAAGGNALSGARLEQEGRYANLSNANFNRDWGNILSNQYSQERGYQQQAPGMQENLARTALAGYGQQTQQGMIPWEVQNQNYQNQYNDWRNATSNMYRDYTQGGQTFKDLMAGRYQGFAPPNYGESAASGWAGLLSGLLGGGNGQGGGLQGLLKALGLGNNKTSPGSGSQSGGGGTPGRDANGRTPGQMGYDPTTDPGSSQSQWSDLGEALTYYGLSPDEINMVQTSGIDPGDLANYLNSGGNIWDLIGNQQQGPDYPYGGEGWTDPTGGFGNPYGDGGGDYTDYANGT